MNDGRTTGDDRLFGHPVEIAGTTLYVSTGLVKFIPVNFGKSIPSMRFNRLCFYLFHAFSSFRGSRCVLPASRFWHLVRQHSTSVKDHYEENGNNKNCINKPIDGEESRY